MDQAVRALAVVAKRIQIRGIVQGVGFRPFVFRLARIQGLRGWVLNGPDGVAIHVEGAAEVIDRFLSDIQRQAPPAARISDIESSAVPVVSYSTFEICESERRRKPTTRISPDLPVCSDCLEELFDEQNPRWRYPYINCTNCGPRYSIVLGLPYDRAETTMANWPLCAACAAEYHDPLNRRFHAQPVACARCGPAYTLDVQGAEHAAGHVAIEAAARALGEGRILAVKGIGGYHLVCDADQPAAIAALRERKYRKEKPFAVMVRDLATAERTVRLSLAARSLLTSTARPIVLAPACETLANLAPDNDDIGVMLPYAPIHHLLFESGAPHRLVMTSGNRSSEPIAYDDNDARRRLSGIADGFFVGERPIARRLDDSIVRDGPFGAMTLRRARGLAPAAVAVLPVDYPILALGGDLKNSVTLVVDGQAHVSQHIGDLDHLEAFQAFDRTIRDLLQMYGLSPDDLVVVHDAHPQSASTAYAETFQATRTIAVQHHRAHIASVLIERGHPDRRVIGVALDGTGYGDDETIWGGEFFVGSLTRGFERVAHLRPARLAGGDAAARYPVQAAAGYLAELDLTLDLTRAPFSFPERYRQAVSVLRANVRSVKTTSMGRLFDTVAALLGFTRPITFEGQAAMWLEHLARKAADTPFDLPDLPLDGADVDWRPMLEAIVRARIDGTAPAAIARAFHRTLARGLAGAIAALSARYRTDAAALSGGVMQNALLAADLSHALRSTPVVLWVNRAVPPNDGGLSLGQAAVAAYA